MFYIKCAIFSLFLHSPFGVLNVVSRRQNVNCDQSLNSRCLLLESKNRDIDRPYHMVPIHTGLIFLTLLKLYHQEMQIVVRWYNTQRTLLSILRCIPYWPVITPTAGDGVVPF